MMTHNQAKVFECIRTGHGADATEIIRISPLNGPQSVWELHTLHGAGWCDFTPGPNGGVWRANEAGEAAYQQWAKFPF